MVNENLVRASFRDPSGFIFSRDGVLYRQVNRSYANNYDWLMSSGLYKALSNAGCLIQHEEIDILPEVSSLAYKVIQPEPIPFISYPYEWSFSQLKDAALLTLDVQKRSIERGMSLKDASAYNVQFKAGHPILIDTLSFEIYQEGQPWVAYRQFCQHFLAPLALQVFKDIRLNQLMRVYIDGVPLDLVSKLLPLRTRLDFALLTHIHLHATAQRRYAGKALDNVNISRGKMSRTALLGMIDNLESTIRNLKWKFSATDWAGYYSDTNYSFSGLEHKKQLVSQFLELIQPSNVWDLGANTGLFSRIASDRGIPTLSFDMDAGAVEINYLNCVDKHETNLLPLVMDLTNPSPALGWQNCERMSFIERGPAGAIFALALVHHLAISNNVPLSLIAEFLSKIALWLIIEFVPKEDSQVQRLLASRLDIFTDYHQAGFERAFGEFFTIREAVNIKDSQRSLYLMQRK